MQREIPRKPVMSKTARLDESDPDSAVSLRSAKAPPKPRAPRARKPKALAVSQPEPEPPSRMNATLKTLLVGAAGGLVGGLIVRSATSRNDSTVGSTLRAVLAIATAWASWSNRRHGNA